jgi:two-component system sensor histidine kinase AgrC
MEGILLGIIGNIIRVYAIYRGMEVLFDSKKELRWHKISAYFCFILFTSAGYYLVHQVYITFTLNILSLSIISLCYTGTVLKKIVVVTSIYVVNIMTESLLLFMPESYPGQDSVTEGILQCIMGMGMLVIAVLYEKTIKLRTKNMELPVYLWGSVLLIPLLSFAMMLKITMIRRNFGESVTELILGILIINVLIIYLYDALQNYYKEKADKENLEKLVSGYSRQLNIMTESYAQIREIRHDLKHHIFSLTHLIQNNQKAEVLNYIAQMERHICNPEEYASSGNKEIDSILNYFLNEAKESLDQLHVHIGISNELNLNSFYASVVIGNLLENAISASQNSEEKYLSIKLIETQNALLIKIENSYDGIISHKNGNLTTRKKEKGSHGIGLQSVKRIVTETGGVLETSWDDKHFYISAMLFQTK